MALKPVSFLKASDIQVLCCLAHATHSVLTPPSAECANPLQQFKHRDSFFTSRIEILNLTCSLVFFTLASHVQCDTFACYVPVLTPGSGAVASEHSSFT